MVALGDLDSHVDELVIRILLFHGLQGCGTDGGVRLHDFKLFIGQPSGFQQYCILDAHFAEVV